MANTNLMIPYQIRQTVISKKLIIEIRQIDFFICHLLSNSSISQHDRSALDCLVDFFLSVNQTQAPMFDILQMLLDHMPFALVGMLDRQVQVIAKIQTVFLSVAFGHFVR